MKFSWLAFGAIAVTLWYLTKGAAPPAGTSKYKITAGGTPYYKTDPSVAAGATVAGTLPAGALVYSTAAPGGSPTLSQDASYELVAIPGAGTAWISIASLLAQ